MLALNLSTYTRTPLKILCLGAHADDIEIGCGATILQLLASRPNVEVHWMVFSGTAIREQEALESASRFLRQATRQTVRVHQFRDGHFPYAGAQVKECFEGLKQEIPEPDLIFTHYREDRHQDHRTISDMSWNTWRRHMILEYEVPKYDGDLGHPNCFVPIRREFGTLKARTICEVFRSEGHKGWMTQDAFEALMRLRGIECGAPEQWAEAFHCRKITLQAHG